MTCIAWDGKTLAADKRASISNYPATVTKISRAPSGELLAFAGDFDTGMALSQWYVDGAVPEKYPDNRNGDCTRATLLVIKGGQVFKYERLPVALKYEDSFTAMGSGRDFALAAMHLGKTAREAVEIACLFDTACGNGVDTLILEPA
jgi:ATP-dependent protease HslVU (ClpYQ) peptidase subunit